MRTVKCALTWKPLLSPLSYEGGAGAIGGRTPRTGEQSVGDSGSCACRADTRSLFEWMRLCGIRSAALVPMPAGQVVVRLRAPRGVGLGGGGSGAGVKTSGRRCRSAAVPFSPRGNRRDSRRRSHRPRPRARCPTSSPSSGDRNRENLTGRINGWKTHPEDRSPSTTATAYDNHLMTRPTAYTENLTDPDPSLVDDLEMGEVAVADLV